MESAEQPTQLEFLTRDDALELLESKEAWKRDIARDWLEQNEAAAGEAILERLREEGQKRKRKQRRLIWAIGIYCAALVGLLVVWLAKGLTTGRWADFPWQLFQAFTWVGIFGSAGLASQFQKNAAQVIARFDDKRYVPELVEALSYDDQHVRRVVAEALTRLLPGLTARDSELLSTEHRKTLDEFLRPGKGEHALALSILKAHEQVGDERDLPAVKKLVEGEAATVREKELREYARECLPFVEQRAESNRAASTLLRASTSTNSELLRPAGNKLEPNASSLLRPTESADSVSISAPLESAESEEVSLQPRA